MVQPQLRGIKMDDYVKIGTVKYPRDVWNEMQRDAAPDQEEQEEMRREWDTRYYLCSECKTEFTPKKMANGRPDYFHWQFCPQCGRRCGPRFHSSAPKVNKLDE